MYVTKTINLPIGATNLLIFELFLKCTVYSMICNRISGTLGLPCIYRCFAFIHICMYVPYAHLVPEEARTSGPLKLELDSCKATCGCWGLNQGPPALNCWAKSLIKITTSNQIMVSLCRWKTRTNKYYSNCQLQVQSMGLAVAVSSSRMSAALG